LDEIYYSPVRVEGRSATIFFYINRFNVVSQFYDKNLIVIVVLVIPD